MKALIAGAALLALAACSSADRYKAIASTCQTYAVALNTAAALNRAGKLTPSAVARIDATVAPAAAVCSGAAPSDDPAAVQKVADLVIAVLEAQK
jgi:uncharacterized lipoprotein